MTDSPVSNASPIEKPPLSPELSVSRSFRKNLMLKNKRSNKKNQLDEDSNKEEIKLNNCFEDSHTKSLNELDKLVQIEQRRQSLYDRLSTSSSTSKEVLVFTDNHSVCQNKTNQNKDFKKLGGNIINKTNFCQLKTTEQLEFVKKNIASSPVNKMEPIANVHNIYFSDLNLTPDYVESSKHNRSAIEKVIKTDNINLEETLKYNIIESENFEDLEMDKRLGGFSKVSDTFLCKNSALELTKEQFKNTKPKIKDNIHNKSRDENLEQLNLDIINCKQTHVGTIINQTPVENESHISKYATNILNSPEGNQLKIRPGGRANNGTYSANIFNDENFADLNISNNGLIGFQKASFTIKNVKNVDKNLFQKYEPNSRAALINGINDVDNILEVNQLQMPINVTSNVSKEENFNDPNLLNKDFSSFQKAHLDIKKCVDKPGNKNGLQNISSNKSFVSNIIKKENCGFIQSIKGLQKSDESNKQTCQENENGYTKDLKHISNNIFKDENFDDPKLLNTEIGGFQRASDTLKKLEVANCSNNNMNNALDMPENIRKNDSFKPNMSKNNKKVNVVDIFTDIDLNDILPIQANAFKPIDGFQKSNYISKQTCQKDKTNDTIDLKHISNNLFKDKNFGDLKLSNIDNKIGGFQRASDTLNNLEIASCSSNNMNNALGMPGNIRKNDKKVNFADIFTDIDLSDIMPIQASAFKPIEGFQKSDEISKQTCQKNITGATKDLINISNKLFKDEHFGDLKLSNTEIGGFQRASDTLKILEGASCSSHNMNYPLDFPGDIRKNKPNRGNNKKVNVSDIFKDIDLSDIMPIRANAFNTPIATSNKFSKSVCYSGPLKKNRSIFKGKEYCDLSLEKCKTSTYENIPESQICESIVWMPSCKEVTDFEGFTHSDKIISIRLGRRFFQNIGETDEYTTSKYKEIMNVNSKRKLANIELEHNIESSAFKKCKYDSDESQSFLRKPKKRLGTHFKPSITMSTSNLEKAKGFFREELSVRPLQTSTPLQSKFGSSSHITPSITPIKFNNLTPIKGEKSYLSNVSTRLFFANESNNVSLIDKTLVPKQFSLMKPTEGNVYNWLENLEAERNLLEQRLRIIHERQNILKVQEQLMSDQHLSRRASGVLYMSKSQNDRHSLRSIGEPDLSLDSGNTFLNMINPQNALLVHFGVNKGETFIKASDGAEIVPNHKGQIGVSEIEHSFSVMQGVDRKLIPEGWVKNHYRWIVWKLASYERTFPQKFEGVFCLDNVVQQLKYRYDREIDNAERSALKKIYEKDDCSQKRLVLCVSNIKKVNNDYELELTDGWYSIRTKIDKRLSNQISKGKLKIGTKIVTCGADIINNSDGSAPLEASSNICLNITFNSTRRVAWWTKLGYQKDPSSIRIPLSSVDLEGGRIGCLSFYVARVYPIKYLEKLKENNVWRNYRAEERKAQLWENEQHSKLEKIMNNVNQVVEASQCDSPVFFENIELIENPEILYKILKTSKDPEKINEILSPSQRASLLSYQVMMSSKNQSKLRNEIHKIAGNTEKRNVTPLLRIRVLDASGDSEKDYNLYIWNPQEYHLSILKEGYLVSAFNVGCSATWGLTANKGTKFREEQKLESNKFENFVRKVISIDNLNKDNEKFVFQEFDTVGIVIKVNVGDVQQLWLSSTSNRLLLLKIYDSVENILLLDGLDVGEVVIACNIIFRETKDEYVSSVADHYSNISKYSKFRHLQEESRNISNELQKMDLLNFIESAQGKINRIERMLRLQDGSSTWNGWSPDDGMDCSQLTTTDIALLECINKLDA